MSDEVKILWTAAATVLGGAIVFVFGQVVSRFLIDPWYAQRQVIGAIAQALLDYAHLFADSGDVPLPDTPEARLRLRRLSSELLARTWAIPGYSVLAFLRVAPRWSSISEASRGLVGLSNTLSRSDWIRKLRLASQVAVSLRVDRVDPGMFSEESAKLLA